MKLRINYSYIAALAVSIVAALLIGAIILLISGFDPLTAYAAMLSGAFSNARHIGDVLEYAMVLCLCGVACDIGSCSAPSWPPRSASCSTASRPG